MDDATDRIESPRNRRVKGVVRLRDRAERDAQQRFLVEGAAEIAMALDAGVRGQVLYVAGDNARDLGLAERARDLGVDVIHASPDAFSKMTYRSSGSGVLLEADQFETDLSRIPTGGEPLLLVVEAIEKPGNLGTMLRTADAAGVSGVVVTDPTTDLFNPNVVRASLGALFWVPVAVSATSETIAWLRGNGIRSVVSTPAAQHRHFDADLQGRVAIVVGAEHAGLSPAWLEAADDAVVIPMFGRGDSLNAAASAAVLLYEAVRQRSG